jgi:ABC-type nitrate/sulfonate/bicarbonate transport system permease component
MNKEISNRGSFFLGLLGTACFLALWEIIGRFHLAGMSWPSLSSVLEYIFATSHRRLLLRALQATLNSSFFGYVLGVVAGLCFAAIAHLVSALNNGINTLSAVIKSIPSIALAPIFLVLLGGGITPAAVASINVFFIIFVSCSSGLKSASQPHHDLFTVFGASALRRFVSLEIPASLPALISGLRLSAPVAIIGAIIGEWFGASRGLGVLIVNAMQNFQITLLWSAVLFSAVSSLLLYILLTFIERGIYQKYR